MLPFQFRQWIGSGGESDHSPVWLVFEGGPQKSASPFKFNSTWLKDEGFQKLVKSNWIHLQDSEGISAAIQFVTNLKRIKKLVIPWEKTKQKEDERELKSIEDQLDVIYQDTDYGFSSGSSRENLKSLEVRRRQLMADQEATWRLKSRAIWLENGDENTKFFHAYAKGRKAANTIWSLKDQEGRSVTSFEGLANMGKIHFQSLFKADRRVNIVDIIRLDLYFPSFVNEEGNQDLFAEVTEVELKETLQSFQKDKSPGPDGWTIEFYMGFFYLIGADLLKVIEESRINGRIHSPLNTTFIALIPKVDDPQSFDDFRPISLCNCIYKIIAKIIARRLKPLLSESISKEQFGFLEGRQIHEAIGVAQEGLHSLKTSREKGTIIKIDLSKSFDRVNWSYIRLLLTHLGFEVPFIKWTMACFTSVSFVVLINGATSPFSFRKRFAPRMSYVSTPFPPGG
jgi:hypothetical protein